MDTEERPGFLRLEELSPAAEQVAKYGTAIVLVALGSVFSTFRLLESRCE